MNSNKELRLRVSGQDPILDMYLKICSSSAVILFHKINDLLDYTLAEQNKLQLDFSNFDVRSVLIDVVEAFEYQARLKKLTFVVYVEENLPWQICSD